LILLWHTFWVHIFLFYMHDIHHCSKYNHTWFKKTNIVGKTLLLYKSKAILLSKENNDIIKHANELSCQLHPHKLQSWTHFRKWSHFQWSHYHHHPIFMTTPHNYTTFEYYHNLEWEIETRSQNQSFIGENNTTLFYCIMWES
jgi:hypothetical protein